MSKKKDKKKDRKKDKKKQGKHPLDSLIKKMKKSGAPMDGARMKLFKQKPETDVPAIGQHVQFAIPMMSIPMLKEPTKEKSLGMKSVSYMMYLDSGQGILKEKLEEEVVFQCPNPSCGADHTYNCIIEYPEIGLEFGAKLSHLVIKTEMGPKVHMEVIKVKRSVDKEESAKQTPEAELAASPIQEIEGTTEEKLN